MNEKQMLTDEQIEHIWGDVIIGGTKPAYKAFARAILAAQPTPAQGDAVPGEFPQENAPKSLEDAYDNPLSKSIEDMLAQMPTDQSYYKAPETKQSVGEMIVNLKKKSVEQMAVEIFNQITGNSLTEKNVKDIISLVALINEIKGE